MPSPTLSLVRPSPFFAVRLSSIVTELPLPFDLYLMLSGQPTLFRKAGDSLSQERIHALAKSGARYLFVPEEQRGEYLVSLRRPLSDPEFNEESKSKFIKESAFLHLHELFTKPEMTPLINEARALVDDMVKVVSDDVLTVAPLMKLCSHDYYTYNHSVNVAVYSIVLARQVFGEDKAMLMAAGMGGLLHDLGKKRISWDIINKTGPLSPNEWDEIKRHPLYGKEALDLIPSVSEEARNVVHQHHESCDGRGYPRGLAGDEITKLSRVVAIADVFDALTTDRSYHNALPPVDALTKMFHMQPGKFDPDLFRLFSRNFDKRPEIVLAKDFDPCTPQPILKVVRKA